jgi:hypothetical protein
VQGQGPEQGSVTGDALNSGSQHQQQQQQSAITTDGVSSGTHHQQQQQQEGLASASTAPPPPQGGARSLRYSRMRGSAVLQAQLAAEIGSGSERARGFYNRLFNTLGWALTECAVQSGWCGVQLLHVCCSSMAQVGQSRGWDQCNGCVDAGFLPSRQVLVSLFPAFSEL